MRTILNPEDVRCLLSGIVARLVDRPTEMRLYAVETYSGIALQLHVAPDDLGKVIGKQGRTARSLRTILSAIGASHGQVYALDICGSKSTASLDDR